jgi:hypothetical protein
MWKYINIWKIKWMYQKTFWKEEENAIRNRMNNVLSPNNLDTWQWNMEKEDRKMATSQMEFLRSVIRITVRYSIKSERIREKLKTNRTVKDTQQYENSWHGHANFCATRIFIFPWESKKWVILNQDWRDTSFNLGKELYGSVIFMKG